MSPDRCADPAGAVRRAVIVDVQECQDRWASDGRAWLITARCAGRSHKLLVSGDGLPLHCNGAVGERAPRAVERAAFRLVFAERAEELLAALDRRALLARCG